MISTLFVLLGCNPGGYPDYLPGSGDEPQSDETGTEADLPAPPTGTLDATAVSAGELAGAFSAVAGCEDPTVQVITSAQDYAALVATNLPGCTDGCTADAFDWATEAAVVAWSGCTDACDRTLTLSAAKVTSDGTLDLAYQLYNPSPMGCADRVARPYAIHAVPLAAYSGADASVLRTEAYEDTGW